MTFDELVRRLGARVEGLVERGRPLASLTTYRLGGPAEVYIEPAGTTDLAILAEELARAFPPGEPPVLVLGRGSNLVVSDGGWPGVVIRMGPRLAWMRTGPIAGGRATVEAGAATALPVLANWAARRSLSGIEWFVAIPGSVGGAVRMNAGAHGQSMAERLASAQVFDLAERTVGTRAPSELAYAYRSSAVADTDVVIEARLELSPGRSEDIKASMEAYRSHRAATQPGAAQNAGSVFKNPPGDSAGRLVEAAGLKGFAVGGASVSELHANFFMAAPGASAEDVFELVRVVGARVAERFGVELEPEIRFAGSFATRAAPSSGGGR